MKLRSQRNQLLNTGLRSADIRTRSPCYFFFWKVTNHLNVYMFYVLKSVDSTFLNLHDLEAVVAFLEYQAI